MFLIGIGDSAFKMPEEADASPLVMRGYVWALASHDGSKYNLQVLEYVSSRQHHVCRGVWSAELHNQCDMCDMGLILSSFFEELRYGQIGCEELRKRQVEGTYSMEVHMYTDSYSIYSYLRSAHLKFPAEKATYLHLAYLKEKLDTRAVKSLTWVDTRDMVGDGLTKGMADRSAIHKLMQGEWTLKHPCESFAGGEAAPQTPTTDAQCRHLLAELVKQRSRQTHSQERFAVRFEDVCELASASGTGAH